MTQAEFDATRQRVIVPEGTISYVEKGEGPVALFIHGLMVNSYLWRHQLVGLSDIRRCIAPDLLAHGHTDTPLTQDVSFESQADMLAHFLDALGIDKVDLVANDSGVGIAQIFAVRFPARVRSLVLTNGDVHDNWPPQSFSGFLDMVKAGGLGDTLQGMVDSPDNYRAETGFGLAYARPDKVSDETVQAYIGPLVRSEKTVENLKRFVLAFDNQQTVAIEHDLQQLSVPALVVWGTDDPFFAVDWAHWLVKTLPGATGCIELDGQRMLFPEEQPDAFNTALRQHLLQTA
ncbi:alpha/beta hydrolase [Serratia sp. Se-PFBMAAmG]|uniref:alpha/beta fold hydrolase n=2 Tax=unclassified Serratia (in: enterobacteria) TaxID=2647522 RepID=UPI0024AEB7F4|nr:alpha/beta hydrolase [Serratia sp. Se-RSBMAAmG]MDI6935087.1 alpha/beta hydrolase [Serratia sp. Se-PFBMAAmG]MDI6978487.1 alpha/beta hydrolase [Serratia sp. Se-RSBMAAmG]